MPTTRRRHVITETDELAAALDNARAAFPGASRAELVRRLAVVGSAAIVDERERRADAVRRRAGRHPGLYPPDHLTRERDGWPA